ncbi:hypothetical protein F4806DRAFT_424461 [Annulohypoxylon nitens]|nr:hypothetical protein F4806DRAFT_424461 [Annulohypoxylon nitens]
MDTGISEPEVSDRAASLKQILESYRHATISEQTLQKMSLEEALLVLNAPFWDAGDDAAFILCVRKHANIPPENLHARTWAKPGWAEDIMFAAEVMKECKFLSDSRHHREHIPILLHVYAIARLLREARSTSVNTLQELLENYGVPSPEEIEESARKPYAARQVPYWERPVRCAFDGFARGWMGGISGFGNDNDAKEKDKAKKLNDGFFKPSLVQQGKPAQDMPGATNPPGHNLSVFSFLDPSNNAPRGQITIPTIPTLSSTKNTNGGESSNNAIFQSEPVHPPVLVPGQHPGPSEKIMWPPVCRPRISTDKPMKWDGITGVFPPRTKAASPAAPLAAVAPDTDVPKGQSQG